MKFLIHAFEGLRKKTGFKPHYIETGIAALVLIITALISNK